jgi:hydrogenase maturation protein HypF
MTDAYEIHVKGLVQGVGFRPFIYRLATQHGLKGWVVNRNDGVVIKVQADPEGVDRFIGHLKSQAPLPSAIRSVYKISSPKEALDGFHILQSHDHSDQITDISPDISVCPDCIKDMKHQLHRLDYPFINCTNCGPRFSIIRNLPYDRPHTTMNRFFMCRRCQDEYDNVKDRRFHAQPLACNFCGPKYTLREGSRIHKDMEQILHALKTLLYKGSIIAVKGVGGFHLMCDATNDHAIQRIRMAKHRDQKPFACMFPDIAHIKEYAVVDDLEEDSLLSWRRPIVLLRENKKPAPSLNPGVNTLGVMLPYMPLHYLLFEVTDIPALVMTSGNVSGEPLIVDNETAVSQLDELVDAILTHNREIFNRVDDSVIRIISNKQRLFRRSRGFAPEPINLNRKVDGIFATGAELKNCFCIGKGYQAIMSQHMGDLKNFHTYQFYGQTAQRFMQLFRMQPHCLVSDNHPDYLSTRFAKDFIDRQNSKSHPLINGGITWIQVQHHHAHIVSCMVEHDLDEPVLGVALDGNGYGDDGKIWGGEFMISSLTGYNRYAHFDYIPMPGGDQAAKEPWRMGLAFLFQAFGGEVKKMPVGFLRKYKPEDIDLILSMLIKDINSPLTSSAGRLFDAVAAILDLCHCNHFEAEAPMMLESYIDPSIETFYNFAIKGNRINFVPVVQQIIQDLNRKATLCKISTKFHNTIARVVLWIAQKARRDIGLNKVILSGGTFQNRYLSETTEGLLKISDFEVFQPIWVPSNDGGIALGQLVIAAERRKKNVFEYTSKSH